MTRESGNWWRWQNLTKDDNKGKFPFQGRAWWSFGGDKVTKGGESWFADCHCLSLEWNLGRWAPSYYFEFENAIEKQFSLGFWLIGMQLYVSLESPKIYKLLKQSPSKILPGRLCLYYYNNALWFSLWGDSWESNRDDPWWRKMYSFHFDDFFLGKSMYSCTEGVPLFELFEMDGKSYLCKATAQTQTWKRPRWRASLRKSIKISFDEQTSNPPEFSGKGENSWDCGDDAIWCSSYNSDCIRGAVDLYKQDVMKNREKYGNPSSLSGSKT